MDKAKTAARIVELAGLVQYHADLYYNKAKPEITDKEYDVLVDELRNLVSELEKVDSSAQEIAQGKETLNNVGATPSYGRKVTHSAVMGSLDKDVKVSGIVAWFGKYGANGGEIAVTPKIDGCAIRLNYENGVLRQAATRGDGMVGQDVTDNIRATKSVPKFIGAGKTVEVRGECIMPRSVFQKLAESGERSFANPRNAGSGSLMAQDPQVTGNRNLEVRVYDVIVPGLQFKTEGEKREWMLANLDGLPLVDMSIISIDKFESLALKWESNRPSLDYEIDGLVISLNSIDAQDEAGWDGRRPRGKIAFKFPPEQKTAKVLGIDWQVGRTGRLTPMARIEPTLLAGSTIRNITLHNAANVEAMKVAIGDEVLIEKAGDIIPQVVRVVDRPGNRDANVLIDRCPSCLSKVSLDEQKVNLWCESPKCPAQLSRRVLHWIKTLDVMGVGSGIVDELCQQGYVKDVPDLYYLTMDELRSVTGGDRAAEKVQHAILGKSDIPLPVFLDGLGIDGLGTTSSKDVAKKFQTLKRVRTATVDELDAMPDIGTTTAKKIVEGLTTLSDMIDRLEQTIDIQEVVVSEGPLKGLSFVLTGAMSKPRKEIETAIEKAGGENKGSVGKGVTFLVQADPTSTSSKTEKAKKVGTQIISEKRLWEMIAQR